MNPLAEQLNDVICKANPYVFEMLSELGKRFYFPSKGILSQSAEAKRLGTPEWNATIGTAITHGNAMHLDALMNQLPGIPANAALLYAPSTGLPGLRSAWKEKTLHDNPSLQGKPFSLPIVTGGLSHGLSLLADLVVDTGDLLILPDKNWGNYKLNFIERKGAVPSYFPLFSQGGFHVQGLRSCLEKAMQEKRRKAILLLNFPNNPTGYTPTDAEGCAIRDLLVEYADRGMNLVVIVDDAYYGLFFEKEDMHESLFAKLAGLHPRILAFKADAATKEVYVWGLRVGFISFSVGNVPEDSPLFDAVIAKMGGIIRSVVSSCCALSQHLITEALKSPEFYHQRAANVETIRLRAACVRETLAAHPEYAEAWEAYPFNSGYFMCLKIRQIDAAELRLHLLNEYKVGTIAINDTDLRVAFSSVEKEVIPLLFEKIFQAWKDLANRA